MVVREVKPVESGGGRPRKGRLTWMALAGFVLFAVLLLTVVLRPIVDRHDGPEVGTPAVNVAPTPAAIAAGTGVAERPTS